MKSNEPVIAPQIRALVNVVKRKLIYILVFLTFFFLTGGIEYKYITFDLKRDTGTSSVSFKYQETIGIFGFYYQESGEGLWTITERSTKERKYSLSTSYGWKLDPSLRIISITREARE